MAKSEKTFFALLTIFAVCALGYSFYVAAVADHLSAVVHSALQ